MLPNSTNGRARFGAFLRDFLRTLTGSRREFGVWETRGAIVVPLPQRRETAECQPAPVVATPRRSGRLIDLERRAKFGQFGS